MQFLTYLRELCAMSLSLQNYHGCLVWVANNGSCRFIVSRTKAAELLTVMKEKALEANDKAVSLL
ncbi:hypothetical protein F0267_22225 [Vibrio coralliilyticus]|uniref:Uncharacterized protein n=1 Tax=Vibrio coralliilyticus TaxID=190893 RepID=A0AAN0W065_9VIBR|nr:hypothetical protein IX92_20185 [Vibrio coralliilyticus]NOH40945.1 hypothetical protein [Vibrio coralliilyticus]